MHTSHASTHIELLAHPRMVASTPAMHIVECIRQWPHWSVIAQVATTRSQLRVEDIDRLLPEYQRFLALCITHKHSISMFSVQVDALWHAYLLHTRLYEAFCLEYAGQMLHHVPNVSHAHLSACEDECKLPDERCVVLMASP